MASSSSSDWATLENLSPIFVKPVFTKCLSRHQNKLTWVQGSEMDCLGQNPPPPAGTEGLSSQGASPTYEQRKWFHSQRVTVGSESCASGAILPAHMYLTRARSSCWVRVGQSPRHIALSSWPGVDKAGKRIRCDLCRRAWVRENHRSQKG